jgi:ABC-type lipoprotein release transport system permease subunit
LIVTMQSSRSFAWLEVSRTGLTALVLHPWRALATVCCVLAVLCPYLAGIGIASGLARQAAQSLDEGADLYVTGRQFGRAAPLPLEAVEQIAALTGVTHASPRIVGPLILGAEGHQAVVVGVSDAAPAVAAEAPPASAADMIEGRWFEPDAANELVVGSALAGRLKLQVGSRLPPFYHNRHGEHVSQVVGIFLPEAPIWQANLLFVSFKTAAAFFDQEGLTTEILVRCRPGAAQEVGDSIARLAWDRPDGSRLKPRVSSRADWQSLWSGAVARHGSLFHLHWLLALSVAILAIMVTSGFGAGERRREVGILKALGWQTDEILLRSAAESLLLSLAGVSLAIIFDWVWLRVCNGYGIAGLFLPGLDASPHARVPFRLAPLPVALGLLLSWTVVTCGSLYSTWRTAIAAPREAMR